MLDETGMATRSASPRFARLASLLLISLVHAAPVDANRHGGKPDGVTRRTVLAASLATLVPVRLPAMQPESSVRKLDPGKLLKFTDPHVYLPGDLEGDRSQRPRARAGWIGADIVIGTNKEPFVPSKPRDLDYFAHGVARILEPLGRAAERPVLQAWVREQVTAQARRGGSARMALVFGELARLDFDTRWEVDGGTLLLGKTRTEKPDPRYVYVPPGAPDPTRIWWRRQNALYDFRLAPLGTPAGLRQEHLDRLVFELFVGTAY